MKYIKEKARDTYGYETTEISKEEALEYVSEETLRHLYDDLVRGCSASAALERVEFGCISAYTDNTPPDLPGIRGERGCNEANKGRQRQLLHRRPPIFHRAVFVWLGCA